MRTIAVSAGLVLYRSGGRTKVEEEHRCRMCLVRQRWFRFENGHRYPRVARHHLVPQSWFAAQLQSRCGDEWLSIYRLRDADANIIPLCNNCHRGVEIDEAARKMLRKVLSTDEIAFAIQVRGKRWFDERYPPVLAVSRPRGIIAT